MSVGIKKGSGFIRILVHIRMIVSKITLYDQ